MCTKNEEVASVGKTAATVGQVIVAGAAIASIAASALSGASPGSIFQIINLMQLFMFLILLRVYLPQKVIDFILGNSIFNMNIGLIGMDSIPIIKDLLFSLNIDHFNVPLHELDIKSVSTFYNLVSYLLIFPLIASIHLIFWLIKSVCPKRKSQR